MADTVLVKIMYTDHQSSNCYWLFLALFACITTAAAKLPYSTIPHVTIRRLPSAIIEGNVAHNGAYLVARLGGLDRLVIIDFKTGSILKYIRAQPSAVYASGGTTLAVYEPKKKQLSCWNLETFEQSTTTLSLPGVPKILSMARDVSDRCLIATAANDTLYHAVNLNDFSVRRITIERLNDPNIDVTELRLHLRQGMHWTPDFRQCVFYALEPMRAGMPDLAWGTWSDDTLRCRFGPRSGHPYYIANDGAFIVSDVGTVFEPAFRRRTNGRRGRIYPIDGRNEYVAHTTTRRTKQKRQQLARFTIYDVWTNQLVKTIEAPIQGNWLKLPNFKYQPAWVSGATNTMIFTIQGKAALALVDLTAPSQARTDAIAKRGQRWAFDLACSDGTTVTIEDGPEKCTFDTATGRLTWDIPPSAGLGITEIVITVVEPNKEEVWRTITVKIEP